MFHLGFPRKKFDTPPQRKRKTRTPSETSASSEATELSIDPESVNSRWEDTTNDTEEEDFEDEDEEDDDEEVKDDDEGEKHDEGEEEEGEEVDDAVEPVRAAPKV